MNIAEILADYVRFPSVSADPAFSQGVKDTADFLARLLEKAGYEPVIPRHVEKLCCGKAFETKGMKEQAAADAAAAASKK